MSDPKRVLVTGGGGFVGANLIRRLLREGHDVHLLVRPGFTSWRLDAVRSRLTLHEADLVDRSGVRRTVGEARPQWVFHLAAFGAYSWETDVERILAINVLGTSHLVEAALELGVEGLVNTGSSSEYGFKASPSAEEDRLEPNSCYAVAKAAATHYCCYVRRSRQAPIVTLRLYSVYGPFEDPNRLIPRLVVRGLEGSLPPLVDPSVARDFVFVDDVVSAYLLAVRDPVAASPVYNVGTGRQTTIGEAVAAIRRQLPIREEPTWGSMASRVWDTGTWVADPSRIERELGWRSRSTFEDGLRATIAWFEANPGMLDLYRRRMGD